MSRVFETPLGSIGSFIKAPDNKSIKIWRYLTFPQYVSMLEEKALYFSSGEKLRDEFEGMNPKTTLAAFIKQFGKKQGIQMFEDLKFTRRYVFVNSWHMNEDENYAMWKIYSEDGNSIAIQSTYDKLVVCLADKAYISEVQYIDHNIDAVPFGNIVYPFLYKRKPFSYERELRAIMMKWPKGPGDIVERKPFMAGFNLGVNLSKLIENVYISPTAASWFIDLVKKIDKKYKRRFRIIYSRIHPALNEF